MALGGFNTAAEALTAKAQHLRHVALISGVLGALVIAAAWIIFWPGAGFDQGLPGLIIVPAGLGRGYMDFAAPQTLPMSQSQINFTRLMMGLAFLALLGASLGRKLLRWGPAIFAAAYKLRKPSLKTAFVILLVLTGHWLLAIIVYQVWKRWFAPQNAPSTPTASPTQDVGAMLSGEITKSRIAIGFMALAAIWAVAHLAAVRHYSNDQLAQSSLAGDTVPIYHVVEPDQNVMRDFDDASTPLKAPSYTVDHLDDKRAFVMAQNGWLMGDPAAVIKGLTSMSGAWLPPTALGKRRLGFLAGDAWRALSAVTRSRLAVVDAERNAAKTPDYMRWAVSLIGVILIVWAGFLIWVAQGRERSLDRFADAMPARRNTSIAHRGMRLEAAAQS